LFSSYCTSAKNNAAPENNFNEDNLSENLEMKSTKTIPSLKWMLKKFYLLVHPDFFNSNPAVKEVNEKSFQTLQAYLDDYLQHVQSFRQNSIDNSKTIFNVHNSAFSSSPCKMNFFYRKKSPTPTPEELPSQAEDFLLDPTSETESATEPEQFVQISTILPALTSYGTLRANKEKTFPHHSIDQQYRKQRQELEASLRVLFESCGLDSKFDLQGFYGEEENDQEEETLVTFLSDYSQLARQRYENYRRALLRLDFSTNAVWIQHRIRIAFELPPSGGNFRERNHVSIDLRMNLLARLMRTFQELYESGEEHEITKLVRMTIVFYEEHSEQQQSEEILREKYKVLDSCGRIKLHHRDSITNWKTIIKAVNPEEVSRLKKIHMDRQRKEAELAKRLGIANIFADYEDQNSSYYLQLLDQLNDAISNGHFNKPFKRDLQELTLRLTTRSCSSSSVVWPGVLQIAIGKNGKARIQENVPSFPKMVLETLQNEGPQAIERIHERTSHSAETERLLRDVRRRLRMYRVYAHAEETSEGLLRASECCRNLLQHETDLKPYLWGLCASVGDDRLRLLDDGTVCIQWNFLV